MQPGRYLSSTSPLNLDSNNLRVGGIQTGKGSTQKMPFEFSDSQRGTKTKQSEGDLNLNLQVSQRQSETEDDDVLIEHVRMSLVWWLEEEVC